MYSRGRMYSQYFRDRPAFYLQNARIPYKHITLKSNNIRQACTSYKTFTTVHKDCTNYSNNVSIAFMHFLHFPIGYNRHVLDQIGVVQIYSYFSSQSYSKITVFTILNVTYPPELSTEIE